MYLRRHLHLQAPYDGRPSIAMRFRHGRILRFSALLAGLPPRRLEAQDDKTGRREGRKPRNPMPKSYIKRV